VGRADKKIKRIKTARRRAVGSPHGYGVTARPTKKAL